MTATAGKPGFLVKPTLDTKYHIDFGWWDKSSEDLRMYLLSHLLPEQRERLSQTDEERTVDYIDPDTGEVMQLDELGLAIQIAAEDPNFINPQTSLVDSIFRVFLANGNVPLSPRELEERTGRSAQTILKTLSGGQVYKGIRPILT
ncbi:MAG: hypothetical protein JNM70_02515 [Anaerolineae bacterium]|nr:hypothetical protein [Anaerolineae bacterium]